MAIPLQQKIKEMKPCDWLWCADFNWCGRASEFLRGICDCWNRRSDCEDSWKYLWTFQKISTLVETEERLPQRLWRYFWLGSNWCIPWQVSHLVQILYPFFTSKKHHYQTYNRRILELCIWALLRVDYLLALRNYTIHTKAIGCYFQHCHPDEIDDVHNMHWSGFACLQWN